MKSFQIEGQMDLFSLLIPEPDLSPDSKYMLTLGTTVYVVEKGEIKEYEVADSKPWEFERGGVKDIGYQLINSIGTYHVATNTSLGETCFTDYSKAKAKAGEYLAEHKDVLFPESINPVSIRAYSYVRKCDNRNMICFLCDLGNDMYYIKNFYTFHHIVQGKNAKKALKEFEKDISDEHESKVVEISDYKPVFVPMYKTMGETNWDYAEAGYSLAVG